LDVQDEHEAEMVVLLLQYVYTGEMKQADGKSWDPSQVLPLLLLADKFGMDTALASCSQALCRDLTVDLSSMYLELPDSLGQNPVCADLLTKSRRHLATHFKVCRALCFMGHDHATDCGAVFLSVLGPGEVVEQ
jgi:hypothetical protein